MQHPSFFIFPLCKCYPAGEFSIGKKKRYLTWTLSLFIAWKTEVRWVKKEAEAWTCTTGEAQVREDGSDIYSLMLSKVGHILKSS